MTTTVNRLNAKQRIRVIAALVEGNSIRATVRMTGVAKNTVVKLLVEIGSACETYQQETLRNLPCKRVQCDEIWSFCYAKQENVPEDKQGQFGYGDVWTWTALCADTKLICCSPAGYMGCRTIPMMGNPKPEDISTSYVERQNLTMRMQMRRFTRLTNAFSKKMDNLGHAVALHFMHYNFCRVHQTLRVTPAMEAGLTDSVWSIEQLVALLDRSSAEAA